MAVTPEAVLQFLEKVDVELPKLMAFLAPENVAKLESFLTSAANNPALIKLADKVFPGMGAVIKFLEPLAGSLDEIAAVIRFFQTILDLFLKAVQS